MLHSCDVPLARAYDLAMLDLDGVVYVGEHAVPGAAGHIARARESGMRVAFITNNASRTPDAVAAHLGELGVTSGPDDVVTSAQAAAGLVAEGWGAGARVLCIGGPGLVAALEERNLVPVGPDDDAVVAASGYAPDLRWHDLMRTAVRIRDGLPWVASNTDHTIPTPYGVAPGHGVLVQMLRSFTGVEPQVAGKPARPLLDETVHRVGGTRPLMVGDRLDTDIEGAHAAGVDSLLVLTGVTGLAELVAARPEHRPTFLAADLAGLGAPHASPRPVADRPHGFELEGWSATVREGRLELTGEGAPDDAWRVAAVSAWSHLDAHGDAVDLGGARLPEPRAAAR